MNTLHKQSHQSGAVSLFVVIFAALLMTVITITFVQLMVTDQQQATTDDLSKSAHDSALAGIEDAKQVLLQNQACNGSTAGQCGTIATALAADQCNTIAAIRSGNSGASADTIIQQSQGDEAALQQAYTCVKIAVNTNDYQGQLTANQSTMVPLTAVGAFDTVTINWFSQSDISAGGGSSALSFPSACGAAATPLPPLGTNTASPLCRWQVNTPALLRAQFIQMPTNTTLAGIDAAGNDNTLFLYPSIAGLTSYSFNADAPPNSTAPPEAVQCTNSLAAALYACSVTLKLPAMVSPGTSAYLNLGSLYNGTHYDITLSNSTTGGNVQFNGVQPEVDSTGRANDVFSRVQARVELQGDGVYPNAALNLTGNLCKDFTITDVAAGYQNSCTP